jgi:hypothetical protein
MKNHLFKPQLTSRAARSEELRAQSCRSDRLARRRGEEALTTRATAKLFLVPATSFVIVRIFDFDICKDMLILQR